MGSPVIHKNNLLHYYHEKKMFVKKAEKVDCRKDHPHPHMQKKYVQLNYMNPSSNFENLIIVIMKILFICYAIREAVT